MKLNNTSELGPWYRYDELNENHHHPNQYANLVERNSYGYHDKIKQQLMFPRVTSRKKYIVTIRQSKQKYPHPITIKPLQIDLREKNLRKQNQNNENESNKFRTISYDPPMISFYNKNHPKLNKKKGRTSWQASLLEHDQRGLNKQTNSLHKMSKIDLLANYVQNGEVSHEQSPKPHKRYEHQFSKKRSLLQLLKYLKNSSSKQALTSRNKNEESPNISLRYQNYREKINMSLQAEPKYLPYFQTRKSHYSILKK